MKTLEIKDKKITLEISDTCQNIINTLHKNIGNAEWLGNIFYKVKSGDFNTKENLVLETTFLYPLSIGDTAAAKSSDNSDVLEAYNIHEDAMFELRGLVHSHHNMEAFFSSTDMTDLRENSENSNCYLSLVVNFKGNYVAKLATKGFSKSTIISSFKDLDGNSFEEKTEVEEDILYIYNLEVVYPKSTYDDSWLLSKIKEMETAKKHSSPVTIFNNYGNSFEYVDYFIPKNNTPPISNKDIKSIPSIPSILYNILDDANGTNTEIKDINIDKAVYKLFSMLTTCNQEDVFFNSVYLLDSILEYSGKDLDIVDTNEIITLLSDIYQYMKDKLSVFNNTKLYKTINNALLKEINDLKKNK